MRNKYADVSDPNTFYSDPGDRCRVVYSPVVDLDGSVSLIASGKEDIQDFIQSFKSQTDMSFILERIAAGDTSVLNQKDPMYGDFTSLPKTYAEALQLVMDREADFMKLPIDVRAKFDHDFKKWFAQSGSEEWFSKMASVLPKDNESIVEPPDAPEEVVKE